MSRFNELLPLAAQVRDATEEGENTGKRVGDLFVNIIQKTESYLTENDEDKRNTKNELIKRIQGKSDDSNPLTDPFKYISANNSVELVNVLNNTLSSGRYRIRLGNVLLDLDVFETGANTTQLLRGFVTPTNEGWTTSLQYNEHLRTHKDAWGAWEVISGKSVKELVDSNTAYRGNYIGNYPFSQKALAKNVDKLIITGYIDFTYNEKLAYMFSVLSKEKLKLSLYSKPKDVLRKDMSEPPKFICGFTASKLDNSPYYFAKFGNSWLILDLDKVTEYDSLYDYDGIALSPSLFKNGGIPFMITELSDSIGTTNDSIGTINDSIDELTKPIFENKKTPYNQLVQELWVAPTYIRDGVCRFKTYNGKLYLRIYPTEGDTTVAIWNSTADIPDETYTKTPISLTVSTSNDATVPKGTEVAFIVLNDITKADNSTAQGEKVNISFASVRTNSPIINEYLASKEHTEAKESIESISTDLEEVKESIESIDIIDYSSIITAPDIFEVIAGDTLQIFKRSIVQCFSPYKYDISFSCAVGKDYPRYFTYATNFTDEARTIPLTITVRSDNGNIICQKESSINVIARPAVSSINSKKILIVGASSIESGHISSELKRRIVSSDGETVEGMRNKPSNPAGLGATNIEFVGRKTVNGVNQEATGGWSWKMYSGEGVKAYRFYVSDVSQLYMGDKYTSNGLTFTITEINVTDGSGNIRCTYTGSGTISESGILTRSNGEGDATITYNNYIDEKFNPFYNNSKLDFKNYADLYCKNSIDILVAHCGVNDMWDKNRTVEAVVSDIKTFIECFHADFPNSKFVLSTLPLPDCMGGMGANYGCAHHYYTKALKFWELAEAFNKLSDDLSNLTDSEGSKCVYCSQVLPAFDCEYGYPKTATSVNNRVSTTEDLGTNGVHPSQEGSKMVADSLFATIVKLL